MDNGVTYGVSWVDDLLLGIVDNSEGSETVAGAELARPAGADGEATANVAGGVGLGCGRALDLECAGNRGDGVLVDLERPGADAVAAGALHALDGPLGSGFDHHVDGGILADFKSWGGEGGGGKGRGEEGELHVDGGVGWCLIKIGLLERV